MLLRKVFVFMDWIRVCYEGTWKFTYSRRHLCQQKKRILIKINVYVQMALLWSGDVRHTPSFLKRVTYKEGCHQSNNVLQCESNRTVSAYWLEHAMSLLGKCPRLGNVRSWENVSMCVGTLNVVILESCFIQYTFFFFDFNLSGSAAGQPSSPDYGRGP